MTWIDRGPMIDLVRQIDPDLVILSLGGNDYWAGRPSSEMGANLRHIHDAVSAAAPDARWILGTQPVPGSEAPESWTAYQEVTVRYAREIGAPLINLTADMPSARVDRDLYAADETHLTDAGHAWIAALAVTAVHELDD